MSHKRAPRYCKAADCGKLLVRREGEGDSSWSERVCCDRKCGGKFRWAVPITPGRRCLFCNEVMVLVEGRQRSKFARQKFCNHICQAKNRRRKFDVCGVNLDVSELVELTGVRPVTIYARVARGIDLLVGGSGSASQMKRWRALET